MKYLVPLDGIAFKRYFLAESVAFQAHLPRDERGNGVGDGFGLSLGYVRTAAVLLIFSGASSVSA